MYLKYNYYSYIKILFVLILFISTALGLNLWLYFQPSDVELALARWIQFGRPDWLTQLMMLISDSYIAAALIVGGVTLWSLYSSRYASAGILALSLASLLFINPIKSIFDRPRPLIDSPFVDNFVDTSFPSGHVYSAVVLAGSLFIVYIIGYRGRRYFAGILMGILYVLLMAWSRVYLQAHYPSDVFGGILFGLLTLLLLSIIYKSLRRLRTSI